MQTFTDNLGRTWYVAINVTTIRRVRAALGIDLYALVEDGLQELGKLVADPIQLANVLYVLCQEDADAKHLSDEDFGRALAGDAIQQAAEALVEDLVDFFPDERSRTCLRQVIAKGKQVREKLLEHAETLLDNLNVDSCANAWIASSMNSRELSASTPDPSPSTSSS